MCSNGFIKGAFAGMLLCAAACVVAHPKKKMHYHKSGIGKSIKVIGNIAENIADIIR